MSAPSEKAMIPLMTLPASKCPELTTWTAGDSSDPEHTTIKVTPEGEVSRAPQTSVQYAEALVKHLYQYDGTE